MFHHPRITRSAAFLLLFGIAPAVAGTLHCQSVNGNLNCAGSGGFSCQTVNGSKVCTSGNGDVVQSFGAAHSSDNASSGDESSDDDDRVDEDLPTPRSHLEQHRPGGQSLMINRDGSRLHVQTGQMSIDRD